jgi:hypothetical protein
MGYSRASEAEDADVILRMSENDYIMLLTSLGMAYASGLQESLPMINRINAGNPDFSPYESSEDLEARAAQTVAMLRKLMEGTDSFHVGMRSV